MGGGGGGPQPPIKIEITFVHESPNVKESGIPCAFLQTAL